MLQALGERFNHIFSPRILPCAAFVPLHDQTELSTNNRTPYTILDPPRSAQPLESSGVASIELGKALNEEPSVLGSLPLFVELLQLPTDPHRDAPTVGDATVEPMELRKRGVELLAQAIQRARVLDLGASHALLQLRLLLGERLVELFEPVQRCLEGADVRLRVEGIVPESRATASGNAAVGEPLYKVLDDEVRTLESFRVSRCPLALEVCMEAQWGIEFTENSSREKLFALGKIERVDSCVVTILKEMAGETSRSWKSRELLGILQGNKVCRLTDLGLGFTELPGHEISHGVHRVASNRRQNAFVCRTEQLPYTDTKNIRNLKSRYNTNCREMQENPEQTKQRLASQQL